MLIHIITFITLILHTLSDVPPVVLFHGLGDACSNRGFSRVTESIGKGLDTYSVCIEIGNGGQTSFFKNFQKQAQEGCRKLKQNPKLQGDIQVVGLSQGALIARYIIESCDFNGKVVRYISIGGPQMGVQKVPGCFGGWWCGIVNWFVDKLVYFSIFQRNIGPAGYFHNPKDQNQYLQNSVFLSDLNNERQINKTKYNRLLQTDMMLVMFLKDSVVYPKESEWFQFRDHKQRLISFFDTKLYREGLLPLKQMYSEGRIKFVEVDADHLKFTFDDMDNIFIPFLRGDTDIQGVKNITPHNINRINRENRQLGINDQ